MRIPKQLKINKRRYKVDTVRHVPLKGTMGETDHIKRLISVATHSNLSGRSFKSEEIIDTFWHELTHAILYEMQSPLWRDERFVTKFASYLDEAIRTSKF
jgi:hypothetical protein